MPRPSKYKAEYVAQAEKLCALGATDVQLADFFGVTESTIYEWKKSHIKFSEALKVSKVAADTKVERSLYERARGYSCPEDKVFCSNGDVTVVPTTKHYPPDTTACIFWLKNRKPDDWRDLRNVNIEIMTDQERMDRIDVLLQSVLDREVSEITH